MAECQLTCIPQTMYNLMLSGPIKSMQMRMKYFSLNYQSFKNLYYVIFVKVLKQCHHHTHFWSILNW